MFYKCINIDSLVIRFETQCIVLDYTSEFQLELLVDGMFKSVTYTASYRLCKLKMLFTLIILILIFLMFNRPCF